MSGVRALRAHRGVKWTAVLSGGGLLLLLLLILAPILLAGALVVLLLAWRRPAVVRRAIEHRRASRIPMWMRTSPMRFASLLLAATLPLAAASYAISGGDDGPSPTPSTSAVAVATIDPTAAPTPEPRTPRPATPTPRPSPQPTIQPTASPTPEAELVEAVTGELIVYFLDVGQGDATLLVAPDATMLIDTGPHDGGGVVPALASLGVTSLDVVAITHAHADHIGQLDRVLANLAVGEVWMSGTPHTTQTFDRAVTALDASSAGYEEPRAGQTTNVGSLGVEILSPIGLSGDLHRDMLTMRVTYGGVSFLFTGDAEADVEAEIIARSAGGLGSTVYHVAHHGSRSSNSSALLAAVSPEVAIYSASAGNQYGHPHPEAMQRLAAVGADVYGTAVHGMVTITTDGSTYTVDTGRTASSIVPLVPAPPAPPAPTSQPPPAAISGCVAGQVDINSAGFDQLLLIIHIGPERAGQIVSLRPFVSVDAMERISGIGPARLADIKAEGIACVP